MKEITVKNIPERIYKKLERAAIRNKHTIDEEVLNQLENIVDESFDNKIFPVDWQKISRINRDNMKFVATEKEISEFKNKGRP